MIFIALFLYLEFEYDDFQKIIKKIKNYINHKIKIAKQNEKHRKAKDEQRIYYEKEKSKVKKETKQRINYLNQKEEKEIYEMETKYNNLCLRLNSIKDQNELIEFFKSLNE